jgi:hypothetical protein
MGNGKEIITSIYPLFFAILFLLFPSFSFYCPSSTLLYWSIVFLIMNNSAILLCQFNFVDSSFVRYKMVIKIFLKKNLQKSIQKIFTIFHHFRSLLFTPQFLPNHSAIIPNGLNRPVKYRKNWHDQFRTDI